MTCRIPAVIDEPDRFGFAYRTFHVHAVQGEESSVVSRSKRGVWFDCCVALGGSAGPYRRSRTTSRTQPSLYLSAMSAAATASSDREGMPRGEMGEARASGAVCAGSNPAEGATEDRP
ncbi:MAG: DUF1990 domain-containing protein [Actinomycetota bacterium]|nr:DUF1990 domain-containing protein [Actinomycetota bacterium]